MQDFRKLVVWQKAHKLILDIYIFTKKFPKEELYGITSQIRRAAASITANISEGCGRKTKADFARFLTMALGSTNEVEYFLLLSKDLEYLDIDKYDLLTRQLVEIRKMLLSLENKISSESNL
jgi:four helix bundle protein